MADGVFNIAKGRVVEYYNRVKSNDPAASTLVVLLFEGTLTDALLKDMDDIAEIEASALVECVFTNYARKVLTDSDLAALPAPDDSNDRYDVDIPDQTWTSAGNGDNDNIKRLIIAYDETAGIDALIIPLCFYDFVVATDGSNLTAQVDAQGFFSAGE